MRKKVLLVIPELSMGGAQRSLSKLSLELIKRYEVWVVIFNKKDGIAYSLGGKLISLEVIPTGHVLNKLKSFVLRIVRLKRLKRKLGIDVSISFLEGADYVNILSKSADKVVVSIRGSKQYDETMAERFSWLRNKVLIPTLYRFANVIVTVNKGIANELQAIYGLNEKNIFTIGNFYDTETIRLQSDEPKSSDLMRLYNDPVLVTTGRLAPEKGLKPLVRIFHALKMKHPALRLVMVGDGPEYSDLVKLCNQRNLLVCTTPDFDVLPDVLLLGNQSNVFKYLKGASLYLMNSSSEGFPNGLAEAMICNVPVVSSDCPYGPREILAEEFPFEKPVSEPYVSKNGIIMPMINSSDDEKIWVQTLDSFLTKKNELTNFARNGYERISFFDQGSIFAKWQTIIEKD